jgi:hypothetical protein
MALPRIEPDEDEPRWRILTMEEGRAYFDEASRNLLGISGEEFLRRWDAGEYRDAPDTPESSGIRSMAMLIPLARDVP